MKLKEIQLADLSRYRGQLMGAAIVFIILFHVPLSRSDAFFGLRRCGNIGVDMFLFLSGIGLWYAGVKLPSVRHFYRRRLLRLFPAWLVVSSAYYLQRFNFETGDYLDLLLDITVNWGFWLHDELTFWYVPAIMMLYLWAPFYMKLIARHPVFRWLPVLMVCWCVVVQWVTPVHQAVEPRAHLLPRHQLRRTGAPGPSYRAGGPLAGMADAADDGFCVHLAGADAPRAIPPLCRTHGLYTSDGITSSPALRLLPHRASLVQSLLHIPRRA